MIFDTLENIGNYKGLGRDTTALEYIAKTDFTDLELGKYEVDGDNIYFMVQEYETHPLTAVAEAHEKYIDIQLVLSGVEYMGVAPISCEKKLVQVKEGKDCSLYECESDQVTLNPGRFAVLYPKDSHKPGVAKGEPTQVRKIVVKVKA